MIDATQESCQDWTKKQRKYKILGRSVQILPCSRNKKVSPMTNATSSESAKGSLKVHKAANQLKLSMRLIKNKKKERTSLSTILVQTTMLSTTFNRLIKASKTMKSQTVSLNYLSKALTLMTWLKATLTRSTGAAQKNLFASIPTRSFSLRLILSSKK